MATIISQNTTWRRGETVNLSGEVQVANGVTLTVEPGVTINGNGNTIKVLGVLNLTGSTTSHITSNNVSYSLSNDSLSNGNIQLNYVDLKNGTFLAPTGYGMYGKFDVTNSNFTNVSGFYIWYPTSPSTFIGNTFKHSDGLSIGTSGTGTVTIRNNVFFDQTTSFAVQSWVSYNNGIFVDKNSFLSTELVALAIKENYPSASIVASNNYFGTTSLSVINSMILDRSDSLNFASTISTSNTNSPDALTPLIANSAPTGTVVINGQFNHRGVIEATNTISDSDGVSGVSYIWQGSTDQITWTDITSPITFSFIVPFGLEGRYIRAKAIYIDKLGNQETVASASSLIQFVNTSPTGSVSISGTARQGETLTVTNTLVDVDGLTTIAYVWKSSSDGLSWSTISNGSSLNVGENLVGKYLQVFATYTDGKGTLESIGSSRSSIVINVNDIPTGSVAISGKIKRGETVTASNTIGDPDGIGAISYKWQSSPDLINWSDVSTGASLTIADAQVGNYLRVNATYTDGRGTIESVNSSSSDKVLFTNHPPTGSLLIIGSIKQGEVVLALSTLADSDGIGTITYKWQSSSDSINWSDLSTGTVLTINNSLIGKLVRVTASYVDGKGTSESVSSTPIGTITNNPPIGAVSIIGNVTQGETLTATNNLVDLDGLGSITYKWQSSTDNTTWTDLSTGSTLSITTATVGKYLRVNASYVDRIGTNESVTSAATSLVKPMSTTKTESHVLSVIVDKGVFGQSPVLLKDLTETMTLINGVVDKHTVKYAGSEFNYNQIQSLITPVLRDNEFTSQFNREINDYLQVELNITYKAAVALVGLTNMDSVILMIAGSDGNFVS
jgi:hypothetical protein